MWRCCLSPERESDAGSESCKKQGVFHYSSRQVGGGCMHDTDKCIFLYRDFLTKNIIIGWFHFVRDCIVITLILTSCSNLYKYGIVQID